MAFFGLTNLGYQYPIGDKMIDNPRGTSYPQENQRQLQGSESGSSNQWSVPSSSDIHHGSHRLYKEMVRQVQIPQSPDQLYRMPLTSNQQYGWMSSKSPEPWTKTKRFPRKTSDIVQLAGDLKRTHGLNYQSKRGTMN